MGTMKKIHLGAGSNHLEGWENYDREVDLRERLPFGDGTIDRIFCEHTIEHITQAQGCRFLEECFRVLGNDGRLRLSFPTPPEPLSFSGDYRLLIANELGVPAQEVTSDKALRAMFWHWGHSSIWTPQIAIAVCKAIGFSGGFREWYGESNDPELRGIDCRHLHVGLSNAAEETGIVEVWK